MFRMSKKEKKRYDNELVECRQAKIRARLDE